MSGAAERIGDEMAKRAVQRHENALYGIERKTRWPRCHDCAFKEGCERCQQVIWAQALNGCLDNAMTPREQS